MKKSVISSYIRDAVIDYVIKVHKYTSLDNDSYEDEYARALEAIEASEKSLLKLISNAEKV